MRLTEASHLRRLPPAVLHRHLGHPAALLPEERLEGPEEALQSRHPGPDPDSQTQRLVVAPGNLGVRTFGGWLVSENNFA